MTTSIVLFSSSRKNGNTRQLINDLNQHTHITTIDLSNYRFSDYDYDHQNLDDDFLPLVRRVLAYDNIIFASPVYWYSTTPTMKRFLDRITDLLDVPELKETGKELRRKTGFVLATSVHEEISSTFLACFEHTFKYLGMNVGGHIHAQCKENYESQKHQLDIERFTSLLNEKNIIHQELSTIAFR